VFFLRRSPYPLVLLVCLLMPLSGCANSSLGNVFQRSLKSDDPAKLGGGIGTAATTVATSQPQASQLPADFPLVIPRYPGAVLQETVPGGTASTGTTAATPEVVTRWTSGDPGDRILSYYRDQLQGNNWQLLSGSGDAAGDGVSARQGNLNVSVRLLPAQGNSGGTAKTTFEVRYSRSDSAPTGQTPVQSSPSPSPSASPGNPIPSFSATTTLGASGNTDPSQNQLASGPITYVDLDKAPKQLQSYVQDLAALGVLTPSSKGKGAPKSSDRFEPNQVISRRDFARWLVSTNNRLNVDRPAQQIRLALDSAQPAFKDVPRSDSDFGVIQGLAEAGIIPSPLSGDSTAVNFRPDAPLTRETLLLWKVPLDTRQGLPTATIDAVQQTWGFQDTPRIDPRALRAVLADYQNSDLSNIRRVFGYTTLFQPKKSVTRAEAAAALWYFGFQGEGQSAQDALRGKPVGNQ
jgi:hypothetical protein